MNILFAASSPSPCLLYSIRHYHPGYKRMELGMKGYMGSD